jgi:uncharacterized membrane protein
MVPLIVLTLGFVVLRALGAAGVGALADAQTSLRGALALMLLLTASAHWGRRRADLVAMVPPGLPRPDLLVTLTGGCEIAAAVGLLVPPLASAAAVGLVALFVAMFPANVYAARTGASIAGKPVTPIGPRTVIQLVFLAAAVAAGWPR